MCSKLRLCAKCVAAAPMITAGCYFSDLILPNVYLGYNFNKNPNFSNTNYAKVVGNELESYHGNYKYKIGLNINTEFFRPRDQCTSGGLYFTDYSNIREFRDYGTQVLKVKVPWYAKVYLESPRKFKANILKVTEVVSYDKFEVQKN